MGGKFDGKLLNNVKSPPYALHPPCWLYIDRCIREHDGKVLRAFASPEYEWPRVDVVGGLSLFFVFVLSSVLVYP